MSGALIWVYADRQSAGAAPISAHGLDLILALSSTKIGMAMWKSCTNQSETERLICGITTLTQMPIKPGVGGLT